MSDDDFDFDTDDGQQEYTLTRKDARKLQKAAREGREAQNKLAEYERERAFVQAGVPVADKRASYFIAGYSGELDPTAIKTKWDEDFGPSDVGSPQEAADLAEMARANELAGGSSSAIPADRLAERDNKWKALSDSDPHYQQKWQAIADEYGTVTGSLVG